MFQKATQDMVNAPASEQKSCLSDKSRTSSRSSSPSRSQSPCRSIAELGKPACNPVDLHKARIESTFKTIEYTMFNNKPACLIVIDVRFIYNKNYQMRSANIEITFSKDPDSSANDASSPRTTDTFGPTEYFGNSESISQTQNINLTTPGAFAHIPLPTLQMGRSSIRTQDQKWQIQGTREKCGLSQSYNWTIFDNDFSNFESFPRDVKLWMVVEHDNMPFQAEMRMDGKLRGHMATNAVSHLSTKRMVELRLFTPSPCTRARFDESKLQDALKSGLWNEDVLKSCENVVSETEDHGRGIRLPFFSCGLPCSLFWARWKPTAVC